jgi:8-oxo-dGTP diphosphatase
MSTAIKRVHVVAGIIRDAHGRILISRRHDHLHQGGLWEFPGGKIESDETVRDALARELREELALTIIAAEPFQQIRHDYPDKSVLLDFWLVSEFAGEARGVEGQPVEWVSAAALRDYQFPAANVPIVEALIERFIASPAK